MKNSGHFRLIFLPTILMMLIIAFACKENTTAPVENGNVLAGQIVDAQDMSVPGAIIQVYNTVGVQGLIDKDTTDEDGFFELSGLPAKEDNLKIRIDHEDFESYEIPVVEAKKDKDRKKLNLKLQSDSTCTAIINISTINGEGNALGNVEVRLNRGDKLIRKAHTNDAGLLVFEHVCAGEYWLRLAKEGFRVKEESQTVGEGDTISLSYTLLGMDDDTCCKGVITFNVKDSADNTPVANVNVHLWHGSQKIKDGITNADGSITFDKICDGEYQISYTKDGYAGQEFNFTMGCSDTVNFDRTIYHKPCCDGVVYLIVKDSTTNSAIENVKVNLWQGDKIIKDPRTNSSGMVTLSGLCEGKYSISLINENYHTIEFSFEIGCNDTLNMLQSMLRIQRDSCCNGSVEITVIDKETKAIVNNATLKLWKNGALLKTKKTEGGKAYFDGLCEGEYWCDIISEHYKSFELKINLACDEKQQIPQEIEKFSDDSACCKGVIKVSPRDKESGQLIKGSRVKLWSGDKLIREGVVEEDAIYFTGICEGRYQFSFFAEGYQSAEENFEMSCNDTIDFPFLMTKHEKDTCCEGSIQIFPIDSATGLPIPGAKVKIWKGDKLIAEKFVESDNVMFDGLCTGKYGLVIIAEGYQSIEFHIELACNEHKVETKHLVKPHEEPCCNGTIKVRATDEQTGIVIHNAIVKLWKGGDLLTTLKLEGDYVIFQKICEGHYAIDINHEQYQHVEYGFDVGCDQEVVIEKTMKKNSDECCNGFLYATIKDSATGNPINGAQWVLYKGDTKKGYGSTNDNGVFTVAHICEGNNYAIVLEKSGYNRREIPITFGCNDTLHMTYSLLAKEAIDTCDNAELALVVKKNDSDERIAGAHIVIKDLEGHVIAEGTTNEDGSYTNNHLVAPKKYKIYASKDGFTQNYAVIEWTKCERKEATIELQPQ